MKRKSKHPKITRLGNRLGAVYNLLDTGIDTNKRAVNCPTCGTRINKGNGIKSSYLHEGGFIIRYRIHCSEKCTPKIIKSK